ncbi:putative ATP-dependent RNA helicase DHR1 [Cladophialophora chaetospira]|uniref:RNA helicase n=1 Tax=Cladophialophora chaetospira TaxID=386627 RepID=A0AA39CCM6_9EURO|nr:putative ATP-dependent RNA helicase DHR1 [Cladophialophora chaetospira]
MPRFVPRQRKHKVLARSNAVTTKGPSNGASSELPTAAAPPSSNAEIILPQSKAEREAQKAALREELRAQQPKVSSKKAKRLDKYIENKLRKDETLDLLRKLEAEKVKYDATVASRGGALGKRKFGEFVQDGHQRGHRRGASGEQATDDDESEDEWEVKNREAFDARAAPEPVVERVVAPASVGSGLAQPLALDEKGLPIIQSRKNKKQKLPETVSDDELPWEGFETETSDLEHDPEAEDYSDFDDDDSVDTASTDGTRSSVDESENSDEDDDTESSRSEASSDESGGDQKIKPRDSVFKLWATQQLNKSIGHTPSYTPGEGALLPAPIPPPKPQVEAPALPSPPSSIPNRMAYAVHVKRPKDIQQSRSELPILQHEQDIMEAIHNNPVVLVKGDTGSGKTTQIPQFLFEAGYGSPDGPTSGMIGITQPRRVAAVSMAKRVATELGQHGSKVAYQIRFDSTTLSSTAIKFMTDGILLRELSQDLLLRKYSVIVIDEAHERSVNTDILIGMLSKIVPARMQESKFNSDPKPLKLVIMSATLNIGDFLHDKLFSADMRPPIVEAEGRQHRVTTHFALRSRADYVEEVIEKIGRAHRKLPRGGILVFLTGQNEIRQVDRQLRALLKPRDGVNSGSGPPRVSIAASEAPLETEDVDLGFSQPNAEHDDFDMEILTPSDEEAEEAEFDVSDDEEEEAESTRSIGPKPSKEPYTSVRILPLYSQLPTSEQLKVFEPTPASSRLIVLATNVAETSLTIPNIRYVFDTGRSKERKYNLDSGVQSFEIDYISKASAAQRAGRAGRTGPGHCWRLYTSAVFEAFFPEHAEPEILRSPAESVVLLLKGFKYPRPVVDFPFPTPPASHTLGKAEQLLKNLGALTPAGDITDLGRQLSNYPLNPRLGKILALGIEPANLHLVWHVLTLVAALAVPEIFVTEAQLNLTNNSANREDGAEDGSDELDNLRQSYGRARATLSRNDKTSDAMKLLTAASTYLTTSSGSSQADTCGSLFLRPKALAEVSLLRSQLEQLVRMNNRATITPETVSRSLQQTKLASTKTTAQLNQILAAGYIDNLCIRHDLAPVPPDMAMKPHRAIDVPYLPLQPLHVSAQASLLEKAVYIHPSSVLARLSVRDLPQYICYSHLQRAQAQVVSTTTTNNTPKTRMFPLCPLSVAQIGLLTRGTALIRYGKPLPKTQIEELGGRPKKRACWVSCELRAEGGASVGALGWGLPPVKVRQVLDVKSREGWRVEEVLS